jgi:hypothetical protein
VVSDFYSEFRFWRPWFFFSWLRCEVRLRDIYVWRVFSCTAAPAPNIDPPLLGFCPYSRNCSSVLRTCVLALVIRMINFPLFSFSFLSYWSVCTRGLVCVFPSATFEGCPSWVPGNNNATIYILIHFVAFSSSAMFCVLVNICTFWFCLQLAYVHASFSASSPLFWICLSSVLLYVL